MRRFETVATVGEQGEVHVVGVPFAPGTEVAVSICPRRLAPDLVKASDDAALAAARDNMRELFRTTTGFRNSPRLQREELYRDGPEE